MRPPYRILNRNHFHRLAAEHLQTHLRFKDYKRKTSAQVLWSLLLAAAAPPGPPAWWWGPNQRPGARDAEAVGP
jgi:hypothetical protein